MNPNKMEIELVSAASRGDFEKVKSLLKPGLFGGKKNINLNAGTKTE
jgi:hypothetical protein